MNTKTTLPATTIRQKFFEVLDKIEKSGTPYTVTRDGLPKAVIMSAEEYEGWIETLDIMSNPETVKNIEESKKQLARGEYVTLDQLMKEQGLMYVRDKSGEYTVVKKEAKKRGKK